MTNYWLIGADKLAEAFMRQSQKDFMQVQSKNLLEMRDRAVRTRSPSRGGTPVESNELRLSASVDLSGGVMGYTKDYAPHVEHGHRVVRGGKQVGYAPGQYFLQNNVSIQSPIYKNDLLERMKEQ